MKNRPGLLASAVRPALLLAMLFMIGPSSLMATGILKGTVRDRDSKDPLPGANVVLKGTSVGASTDLNGAYTIQNAPAGLYTAVVSYIGYRQTTTQVTIVDDQTTRQDFALRGEAVEGQEVVVTAQAQGQLQAINQQLSSDKIVSVVSEARIQELPDFNAAAGDRPAAGRVDAPELRRSEQGRDQRIGSSIQRSGSGRNYPCVNRKHADRGGLPGGYVWCNQYRQKRRPYDDHPVHAQIRGGLQVTDA